jgi:heptaprenyl diphosphate synthase
MPLSSRFHLRDLQLKKSLETDLELVEREITSAIQSEFPFATAAATHLVGAGGKRFRPLLTLLAARVGSGVNDDVITACVVAELTHVATLYHDDVMDEAPLRRGTDSANSRWGNTVAILTGDFLFAKVSRELAGLGPEAVRIHAETFERLCIGQINETRGPQDGQNAIGHHVQVLADKTGSLIATSLRYGAMFAGVDETTTQALTEYGERIGVAFQLADDIVDLASDTADSGKTPGTDLREGVPTLTTLLVRASDRPEDAELAHILSAPITDEVVVQQVLQELRAHPALQQAKDMAQQWSLQARMMLNDVPAGAPRDALASLCDYVVDRSG